ncbi:MAG: Phage putative head morphogenesis protein, SPP1 gp7 family [Clostridiales bacterium 38_11]|nr:MAG: Phage putative head morphogenesis protein, SPP1 gp7 family [Clostridiales bacterium 38_11]
MPAISSKEYWEKRSELNLIQNEKSASQYERQLKKAYEETIRSIRKEVQAFYQRHSDETGVTLTSARRRLKPDEQMDFQKQARKYLDEVERLGDKAFTAEYRDYLKKLSGRAYISQMDELVTNIRHNIETLSTGYNAGLGNTLKDAYEDGYFSTMFDAQKRAGVGVSFTTPGGKQLETAIREKWLGQNYSDRIWADKKKLTDNIEQMLSQEFVRGRGPNDIARDFADRLNVSYSNAQRLIRTEINYISNKGSLQAYKDTGIVEKYRYLATLDSRTSDICRELDGEVFQIKEAKVGVNLPPLHPYCRSTTVPHFDDDDIGELIEDRIARDDDGNGRSVRLGENLKFFDWVDKYGSESFKKKVTAQRAKFKGMDMASSITEALVADEILKAFDPDEYEPLTQEEVIESMKAFYGGDNIDHYDMPDEYRDYVATGNSFRMNEVLYSGRYDDIKSGRVSPDKRNEIRIKQIEAFKDYIDKAPNLHKSTKLVRFVDGDAFEGMLASAIGKSSVGFIPDNIRDAMRGVGDKKAAAQEFTARAAGVMFEANSFISASYNINRNVFKGRDYQLEIYADKGANALMTYNHDESEVVLNVGSRLEFIDVEIKRNKAVIKMRAHSMDKEFTD